jgi:rhamnose utilization protein RhaD (predicted bifunctional aldolase and dehydrogenase)
MSRKLGQPERDLVMLGEGNTSALCDDGTFWVKASGTELRTIEAEGFVQLWLQPVAAWPTRRTDRRWPESGIIGGQSG